MGTIGFRKIRNGVYFSELLKIVEKYPEIAMSAPPSRRLVLSAFKRLHRTTRAVFRGDHAATAAAREEINANFRGNKNVVDETEIAKLVTVADDAEKIFRERVIQAELQPETGRYKVNVRDDTYFFENTEFRDDITEEQYRAANRTAKRRTKKCGEDDKGAKS